MIDTNTRLIRSASYLSTSSTNFVLVASTNFLSQLPLAPNFDLGTLDIL